MSWLFRKLMWWVQRRQKEDEFREELQFHLEEEADERRSEGMSEDQAMRAARVDLGNVTTVREDIRTLWTWTFFEQLARDAKYALRSLRRQPSFACAALTVLVLGVGATTAIFSVLRGVLITPLPYRDPDQLVLVRSQLPGSASAPMLTSIEFAALRAQTDVFESVAAVVESDGNLTAPEHMAPVSAAAVSENFLDSLGVAPLLGRAVQRGDAGRSLDISYDVWQRYFHGNPAIVGRTIEVNNRSVNVVGVLPRGFKAYLGSDVVMSPQVDLLYFRGSGYDDDPFRGNVVIARVRRGVRIATARAAIDTVARNLAADHPGSYRTGPVRLSLAPIEAEVVSGARPALVAAAGAVALVLIVACANLTNLLLARASARTREIAVRIAIGAGRRDIIRQLVAEALVVGTIGAAGGWMLAHWGVSALLSLAPAALPRRESIAVDGGVALFAIALAFVCAVIVSLVPAGQATRLAVSARLTRDPARASRTRGMLVAAQLALSVCCRAHVAFACAGQPVDRAALELQSPLATTSLTSYKENPGGFQPAYALGP